MPEAADLEVEVFALPNLRGVNVLVHGLLGEGVAASTRFDPQAKALGEWLRSRLVTSRRSCCDAWFIGRLSPEQVLALQESDRASSYAAR